MRCYLSRCILLLLIFGVVAGAAYAGENSKPKTENVIIVTLDGFRWQDFFHGADETLLESKAGGIRDLDLLKNRLLARATAEERRRVALLPFLWTTIAKQGQIFGDRARQAPTRLTNGLKFSYPGYSEMFCGFADPEIKSNAKKNNPNLSVLEFLNNKPAYRDKVVAFARGMCSLTFFDPSRNGLKVHAGWRIVDDAPLTDRQLFMNNLLPNLPYYWTDNTFDVVTMEYAREHLLRHQPRVLFIGLGETDEWGHARRYDLYLDAAHNSDRFVAELWKTLQEMPEYKDKTSLILTTDHGRGDTRANWTDHGKDVPSAEFIWIGVLGPDTPPLGVRANVETTQSQVAATIAHLLGEDLNKASPKAAPPLPGVRRD